MIKPCHICDKTVSWVTFTCLPSFFGTVSGTFVRKNIQILKGDFFPSNRNVCFDFYYITILLSRDTFLEFFTKSFSDFILIFVPKISNTYGFDRLKNVMIHIMCHRSFSNQFPRSESWKVFNHW